MYIYMYIYSQRFLRCRTNSSRSIKLVNPFSCSAFRVPKIKPRSGHDAAEERHKPNPFASCLLSLLLRLMGSLYSSFSFFRRHADHADHRLQASGKSFKCLAVFPVKIMALSSCSAPEAKSC